uniref:AlNc14C76G5083 protein n=1 Tax=Albugo laibachii Nc14 TaxID=890382 RepID=F0WEN3_9STRA|nr:AlNc14C76G5083 [Albugo laibachii Nc14]|eukprot:CCA19665.1 AlNc14C76G5083 [Albugo laibachii Nc14]
MEDKQFTRMQIIFREGKQVFKSSHTHSVDFVSMKRCVITKKCFAAFSLRFRNSLSFVLIDILAIKARLHCASRKTLYLHN